MSIVEELREYRDTWCELTGFYPSAMPVTESEARQLFDEVRMITILVPCESGSVPMFMGVELYFTPDAPLRRAALKAAR